MYFAQCAHKQWWRYSNLLLNLNNFIIVLNSIYVREYLEILENTFLKRHVCQQRGARHQQTWTTSCNVPTHLEQKRILCTTMGFTKSCSVLHTLYLHYLSIPLHKISWANTFQETSCMQIRKLFCQHSSTKFINIFNFRI